MQQPVRELDVPLLHVERPALEVDRVLAGHSVLELGQAAHARLVLLDRLLLCGGPGDEVLEAHSQDWPQPEENGETRWNHWSSIRVWR